MPFMTFTDGSVLTAAQVNDYLMKQAVIICTSGTRPSSPIEGMRIYETDTDKVLVYTTATTGWAPPWNMPWGILGYAEVTANQTGIGATITDLTSLSLTITYVANRRVKVTGEGQYQNNTNNEFTKVYIREASVTLTARNFYTAVTLINNGFHVEHILTPTAGARTYKLSANRSSSSGTTALIAASTEPAFIRIEDIGPNGAPA